MNCCFHNDRYSKRVLYCRVIFLSFLSQGFFLWGCSSIDLSQRIIIDKSDWLMCGGSPLQQNITKSVLAPPFKLFWEYDCDAGINNSAVTVADAVVFVNTLQGEMQTVDISSGKKIGTLTFLGNDASSSPLVLQDRVIISYAGDNNYSLACYNLLNHDIDWRINLGYIQTSPIMLDTCVYIGSLDGKEYKIGKTTGEIIWSFDTKSQIHSTCAIDSSNMVFGADNGYIYCLNIKNGSELWKLKTGSSIFSTPLIFQENVFLGSYDSNYYSINIDSGKINWKNNLKTKIYGGSSLYDSSVIFGGIDGNLYSLDIKNGNIIWKFATSGVIAGAPLVSGKYIYFSSFDWFAYCLNAEDGRMIWNYQLDGKGKSAPVIWRNFLFIPADRYIYCFTNDEVK
jgi:outer membrane protein assembly factor BamB